MKKIDITNLFKTRTDKLIANDSQFQTDLESFEKYLNDMLLRDNSNTFNPDSTVYDSSLIPELDGLSSIETIEDPYSDIKRTCNSQISTKTDSNGIIFEIEFSQATGILPCQKDSKKSVFSVLNNKLFKTLYVSKDLTGNDSNSLAENYVYTPLCIQKISKYDAIIRTHFLPNLAIQYMIIKDNPYIDIFVTRKTSKDTESVKYYTGNLKDVDYSFSTLDNLFLTMNEDKIKGLIELEDDRKFVLQ